LGLMARQKDAVPLRALALQRMIFKRVANRQEKRSGDNKELDLAALLSYEKCSSPQ
jgi:hypothetical protein